MDAKIGIGVVAATAPPRVMGNESEVTLRYADFESMYRAEYPALIAVASAWCGHDGEDLVHDAMVRAFVRWPAVRRLDRPGGWCHRVLINLCHSWWRKGRTRRRWLERQGPPAPAMLDVSTEVLAFWAAVRALPERPRSVVTLYYAADAPVAEIARILAVPEGTVRSDLTRARAALARELEV